MEETIVGIDIGALTIKAVVLDRQGKPLRSAYRFHQGNQMTALVQTLRQVTNGNSLAIAVTGSGARLCPAHKGVSTINTVQAVIAGVRRSFPEARNILDIGGASLTLVRLDEKGQFSGYSSNSQCAAGTGSFLDEQAMRLGLTYEEIAAHDSISEPPSVATRCAVFAKSDLIHLQQQGASKEEMWSGLCRGMSQTALQSLLAGKPLGNTTALIGGVSLNREVFRWICSLSDAEIVTDDQTHMAGAIGSGLTALREDNLETIDWRKWLNGTAEDQEVEAISKGGCISCPKKESEDEPHHTITNISLPLKLIKTKYPSFDVAESYVDDRNNEVRISNLPASQKIIGTIGIDIGSTSTKMCLIDSSGNVVLDIYRKTEGDPIGATRKLFDAVNEFAGARSLDLKIIGCGTTGSGRKLVGFVVGADAVVNEISAHVAGALHLDPAVETIFEIGGQDSKYMLIRDSAISDANMNYVCAAGTGSFVEEQARKMGVPVDKVGDLVLGIIPPPSADRCTVFMEQDVNKLIRAGHSPAEGLAAVMRSVVQNYLNKVVGNRSYSKKKIAFQGATARNKGLVAAFETLLDVEMVVSPNCHVMGALGVALLTHARMEKEQRSTTFTGLDLSEREVTLDRQTCTLCVNNCEITYANIKGSSARPSWGYMCGREQDDRKMRALKEYDLFRKRQQWLKKHVIQTEDADTARPVVGIPRALTTYSHLPLWSTLLKELGAGVVLTGESGRDVKEKGGSIVGAEFCFPIKIAHGHMVEAVNNKKHDYIFVPHFVAQPSVGRQSNTFLCPYVQGFPTIVGTALAMDGYDNTRILQPIIDMRLSQKAIVKAIHKVLGPAFKASMGKVRDAYEKALSVQKDYEQSCYDAGRKEMLALSERLREKKDSRPGIVLIGRPYNVNDPGANLDLPRKIAQMGYQVFPIDCLPFEADNIDARYENVFWAYGQRILSVLEFIRKRDDLFAIYLTNFNCGPDSFILSFAEEVMGDKPMLNLELDEHGADAGYITRIEAFLDVVRGWMPTTAAPRTPSVAIGDNGFKDKEILIPTLHPVGSRLFAAAFRSDGYEASALRPETQKDLEMGQRLSRGCECLPMRTTIGSFLNTLDDNHSKGDTKPRVLFMPTAKGPCRFGQYATLQRQILDRSGYRDTLILSPSSENSYSGLSENLRRKLWKAILTADILYKMACRVRPYEAAIGDTDQALSRWTKEAELAFEGKQDPKEVIRKAGQDFARIRTRDERRPLVGIVGEIYVRNNEFSNENLVNYIERIGGEAWMAPVSEWILYTAAEDVRKFVHMPKTFKSAITHGKRILKSGFLQSQESSYYKVAGSILADRHEPNIKDTLYEGKRYLPFNVAGEAVITLGRAVHFIRRGAAIVVNASPFSCMSGIVSASLFSRIERDLKANVVNLFYEGRGEENNRLEVFLANLDRSAARSGPPNNSVSDS